MKTPFRAAAWTSSSPSPAVAIRPSRVNSIMPSSSRTARASAGARSGPGSARPGRGRRSRSAPSPRATPRAGPAAIVPLAREDGMQGAVADPARRALLARLLGEEAHRLGEQAARRVGAREDLHAGGADAAAPLGERLARQRRVERGRRQDPARGTARDDRARLRGEPAGVVVDQAAERDVERRLVAAGLRATAPRDRPEPCGPPARRAGSARRARASRRC